MDPNKRPRLAEVAALAGVSEITASRVMRGAGNVAAATVARVQAAAAELGYLRNSLAGALAGDGAGMSQVAVVLPSLSNAVFAEVLRGIEDRLEGAGYHPVLGVSHYDAAREAALIRSLLSWQPAGLICAPTEISPQTRALLRGAGLPVVEIMELPADPVDMAVGLSQGAAGKAMGYYLAGRGVRRVALVGNGLAADRRAAARLAGLAQALSEASVEIVAQVAPDVGPDVAQDGNAARGAVREGGVSGGVSGGRSGAAQVLDLRPEVICFANDDMAIGGYFECVSRGLQVPEEIGIVGFNGLEMGQALPRPLTTIATDRYRIGAVAAELILERRGAMRGDGVAGLQERAPHDGVQIGAQSSAQNDIQNDVQIGAEALSETRRAERGAARRVDLGFTLIPGGTVR